MTTATKGKIYMFPTPIGDRSVWDVLPMFNRNVMNRVSYFIVENVRTARRFLSRAGVERPIDSLQFAELNEHSTPAQVAELLVPILNGTDACVLPEAGGRGGADPGADLVALAHQHEIEIVPLVGPSSIILALMASGQNGHSFAFNGYLPVKPPERVRAIRHFEKRAQTENQAQIFIETPYRNLRLFEDLVNTCNNNTRLTIAADLLQPDQLIRTERIAAWKNKTPDIHKRPTIFILGV